MGARIPIKALNAVFEFEETRPPWKRVAARRMFEPGRKKTVAEGRYPGSLELMR
jgi:hypothetical protein